MVLMAYRWSIPGSQTNFVHDDDTGGLGLLIKGLDGGGDVTGGDDVGLTLDGSLDDSSVEGIRDEGDDEIMSCNLGFEVESAVDIEGQSGGVGETFTESLGFLKCSAGNGQIVRWIAYDVLRARARDEAASQKEDLLGGLVRIGNHKCFTAKLGLDVFSFGQKDATEFRENKRRCMDGVVVIPGIAELAERLAQVRGQLPWSRL